MFTDDEQELGAITYVLIDPLTEMYEELDYAFTPILFDTVFRNSLIDVKLRETLLNFKKDIAETPAEIWDMGLLDSNNTWLGIRANANKILNDLGVQHRKFNSTYHNVIVVE